MDGKGKIDHLDFFGGTWGMVKIVIVLSCLFVLVTGFIRNDGKEKNNTKQKIVGILYEVGIVLLSAVLALFFTNFDQDLQKKKQLKNYYSVLQNRSDELLDNVLNILRDLNEETREIPEFKPGEWDDVDFFTAEELADMSIYGISNISWLKNREDISFLYTDSAFEYSEAEGLIELQNTIYDLKRDVSYLEECYYSKKEVSPAVVHELYLLAWKSLRMNSLCQFEIDYLDNKRDIKFNKYSFDSQGAAEELKDKFTWIEDYCFAAIPIGIDGDWIIRGYLEKYFDKEESEITWTDIKEYEYD